MALLGEMAVMDIVKENFRTADIFKRYGINYCCSGKVSLKEACKASNLDFPSIENEIEELNWSSILPFSVSPKEWKVDFLIDYILTIHYSFLKRTLPSLRNNMVSFLSSHQKKYPEFKGLTDTYETLFSILPPQMENEEKIIFPYIKQIESALSKKASYGNLLVKTLGKPLANIETEHNKVSLLVEELKERSGGFEIKPNTCTNHQVIYHKLAELYKSIQQLMHLESRHLYPRATAIEQELLEQ